ncbi:MAG: hypothetical protein QXT73_01095 [Candidatus Methanomethylicaceae archaeon]
MEYLAIVEELSKAGLKAGITGLFSHKKRAESIKKHFEKIGKLEELEKYLKEREKEPSFLMKKPHLRRHPDGRNEEIPLYSLLENEKISWDPEGFLWSNGERVAYIGREIIPLKGRKKELREALEKIVELRKESGGFNEKEDPFFKALIGIDNLREYDPRMELRVREIEERTKNIRLEKIKLKVLEELPQVRVNERKVLGIIPKKMVELNPGYEEFFHGRLAEYSAEEIYKALKGLEKEVQGNLKYRLSALKKEFEKREGISKRKALGLAVGTILALSAAGIGLYHQSIKRPYKEAGLDDNQISSFIKKFPQHNGNSTWVSFAKAWVERPGLAESVFQTFNDLNRSLNYLNFSSNSNLLSVALQELGSNSYDFVKCVAEKGLNEDIAYKMLESKIFKSLAKSGKIEGVGKILTVATANGSDVPGNLAFQILDQIEKDAEVKNKLDLADKVFSNIKDCGINSLRLDSIWLLNNSTYYGFRSLEGLKEALYFSENSSVDLNFENRFVHSAIADIGHYFPQVFKYPQEARWLGIQVGENIYFKKIDQLKGKDYVWNFLIVPYTKWRFERLENGSFESLDYKLSKGELGKLARWVDPLVFKEAAKSLYPFDELMNIDMLGQYIDQPFLFQLFEKALELGVKNMGYNSTIGDSPFNYIYKLLMKDMEEKGERYKVAYSGPWSSVPRSVWRCTWTFWQYRGPDGYYYETPESLALITPEPEIAIIKGYPAALCIIDPQEIKEYYLPEQFHPYYSKIIGAMLNRAVVILIAPYPTDHTGSHDEQFVVGRNGDLVGFWYKLSKFLDDYNSEKNPMVWDDYWKNNGPYIKLVDYKNFKRFKGQELSRVLNK